MDFSKYGVPSEQWKKFAKQNPEAARDGCNGNNPSVAEGLRLSANHTRETTAQRVMEAKDLHSQVHIETFQVPSSCKRTIPVRRYASRKTGNQAKVLLFFHGGGLLFGSETTDDVLCSTVALEQNVVVLSVIYRHTPSSKHPAQHSDAWDVFDYIRAGASGLYVDLSHGIGIMGISAGAGLAAGVVLRDLACSRKSGRQSIITGLVLSIPWLIHIDNYPFGAFTSPEKTSKLQCLDMPVVPAARLRLFTDILDAQDITDPLLNIALVPETKLAGWPKTSFLIAGMDPLRDDGLYFATRLKRMGVSTKVHIFPGVPHGFRRWPQLPVCQIFDKQLLKSVRWAVDEDYTKDHNVAEWYEHEETL